REIQNRKNKEETEMTTLMQEMLRMAGFKREANSGRWQTVVRMDCDGNGERNYVYEAVEAESADGDLVIKVLMIDGMDYDGGIPRTEMGFSTFVETMIG